MASGWYCKVMGQLLGPVPLQQVVELAQGGTLMPTDMVRKKTGEWVVANTIRGLFPETAGGATESAESQGHSEDAKS